MINRLNTIDGETLMSRPLNPPNFIIDGLLSQGLHILAGSPKVGKSWLAVTVAKGEGVWGMSVQQGTTLGRPAGSHHPAERAEERKKPEFKTVCSTF